MSINLNNNEEVMEKKKLKLQNNVVKTYINRIFLKWFLKFFNHL